MRFVAFIRPLEAVGPIKIVESNNPRATKATLEAASPVELFLIGAVEGYDYPLKWWCERLEAHHHRDGWYLPSARVLCLIEDVLTNQVEKPGPHHGVPDRVPEHIVRDDPVAAKWAWPKGDPYPPVPIETVEPARAAQLARAVLEKALAA